MYIANLSTVPIGVTVAPCVFGLLCIWWLVFGSSIVVTQCTAVDYLQPGSKCTDTGDVHENAVTVIREMFVVKIFS